MGGFRLRFEIMDFCGLFLARCCKLLRSGAILGIEMIMNDTARRAKFRIGQVVKHRIFPFRGVIFDVDPVFSNTEDWYLSIPEEIRPSKDQPFYHLLAENDETEY